MVPQSSTEDIAAMVMGLFLKKLRGMEWFAANVKDQKKIENFIGIVGEQNAFDVFSSKGAK